MGVRHQLNAGKGLGALELLTLSIQPEVFVVLRLKVLISGNHEAESAAGRVPTPFAQRGSENLDHRIDQRARGEVGTYRITLDFHVVPEVGIEPTWYQVPLDFESSASTSFTTPAPGTSGL
jgi:hypothetical protein